ncbi:hypothetical protein [Streptosporangium sp. KLBMP 9127]|nr:hypothetical protein [Streptosporangium sp. KLBMP 9127]
MLSVGRRHRLPLAIALVVTTVLALGVGWMRSPQAGVSSERAAFVLANGLAASHPDYRIRIDDASEAHQSLQDVSVPVLLDPRPAYPLIRGPEATRRENIELLSSGEVTQPLLRPWRLTGAIREPVSSPLLPDDRAFLSLSDPQHQLRALLVVWLSEPMTENAVDLWLPNGIDVAIFTERGRAGGPVSWDTHFCRDRNLPCPPDELLRASEGFQLWVAALRDDDAPLLAKLGLDLVDLRSRAKNGKMYGFIASAELEEIRTLSGRNQVRSIQIISAGLADTRD